jgi:hypothetical protein
MNPQSLAAFACLVAVLIAGVCGAENVENLTAKNAKGEDQLINPATGQAASER